MITIENNPSLALDLDAARRSARIVFVNNTPAQARAVAVYTIQVARQLADGYPLTAYERAEYNYLIGLTDDRGNIADAERRVKFNADVLFTFAETLARETCDYKVNSPLGNALESLRALLYD